MVATELPAMYGNILVFGGGTASVNGKPAGRIGGRFAQPDYALSYLLAARYVLQGADGHANHNEVVIPAAYLQRHAFELALKCLLDIYYDAEADRKWLEALDRDATAARPAPKQTKYDHKFGDIIEKLCEALRSIDPLWNVPAEVEKMADSLVRAEREHRERLRYPRIGPKEESWPKPFAIPITETQAELEGLFERHFVYRSHPLEPGDSLVTLLLNVSQARFQALLDRHPSAIL